MAVAELSLRALEERVERLDAKARVSPGQLGLDFSAPAAPPPKPKPAAAAGKGPGGGEKCGGGWIDPKKECRKNGPSGTTPDGRGLNAGASGVKVPQVTGGLQAKPMTFNTGGDSEFDVYEEEKANKGGLKFIRGNRGATPYYGYFFRDRAAAAHWYAKDVASSDADYEVGSDKRRTAEWKAEYKAVYQDYRNVLRDVSDRELLETVQAFASSNKSSRGGTFVDVRIGGNKHSRPIREGTFGSAKQKPETEAEPVLTNPDRYDPGLAPKAKPAGINAQDVTTSTGQAQLARQQRKAAQEAGDQKAAEAWRQQERAAERDRLQGALSRGQQSQGSLFGVTEYDETMPLFRQRRDSIDPVAKLCGSILREQLPGAQVLDWSRQPRGITAGRAVSEGLIYRFRLDAESIGYRPAWDEIDERQWELRSEGFLAARDPSMRLDYRRGGVKFEQKTTKRQCSKGYGCGSACISLSKECRVNPKSAISKVRLQQLQALAQEGDPKAAAQAQELQMQREAKAQTLQKGRQTARLEKMLEDPRVAEMVRTGKVPEAAAGSIKPGQVRDIKPNEVEVDPERFQYKIGSSASGEVGSLSGVQRWDPNLAGVISVWQDPEDGKTYVVNGHNRLALAKRLGAEEVTVRYLKAGSAQEARAIGAMQNIAEGAGTEIDAGKFFRDSGVKTLEEVKAKGLPLKSGKAEKGLALAQLPDEMFNDVVQGKLRMRQAAVIGASGLDQDKQREVYKMLKARPSMTDETLQEYVEHLSVSSRQKQEEINLFGTSEKSVDTGLARAELANGLKKALSREARLLGAVSKSSQAVELLEQKGGNTINVEQSQQQAGEASSVLRTFNELKNLSGPIKTALDQAAAHVTAGENRNKVMRELREQVVQAMEEELKRLGLRKEPATVDDLTMNLFDSADRFDSLMARIDAARRKCTTGYGCGSTCINVKKECRSEGGAATSKERIARLEQLSRGEVKPRGLGTPKPAEAAAMAEGLRSARGSKAQQLLGQRKATREAKTAEEAAKAQEAAMAKEATAGRVAPPGTPRGEADRAAKAADPDYEFARPSTVGNVGEDLKGSARHKANQWRSLSEAEANGTAEALVTRDKLLKAEPLDLTEGLTSANYLTRLAGHLALKSFPAQPYTEKAFSAYELGQITDKKTPAEMRKLYYDHLQEVKGIIDRRRDDADPKDMLQEISRATVNRIAAIRGDRSQPNADRFNPLANSLVDLTNKTSRGSYSKTSVTGQINTLGARLKRANETKSTAELAEVMLNATKEILDGASIDKVTGVKKGGTTFNPADLYVKKAVRTGGRPLTADDSPAGSASVLAQRMGMRGLQFGNSVTDDERAHHLRKTAEAMVDLADVTGLPDRAMSLDGQLGLAFGARGKGRAAAHYEPGTKVINITRKNGVGTLAHEWGHALDDYVGSRTPRGQSRMRGEPVYLSEQTSGLYWDSNGGKKSQAEDPVWKAMDSVRKAIEETDYPYTLRVGLRGYGIKAGSAQYGYWTSGREVFARTFERYVQHKLQSKGQENTYLSGLGGDSVLWPTKEQIAQMAPAFDELMRAVSSHTFGGMKRRTDGRTDSRDERIWRFMHAMAGSR